MKIEIKNPYNIIKPFIVDDLPDLIILTGENGSGKTQLLNYIAISSGANIDGDISISNWPDLEYQEENGEITPSLRIFDNEKQLTSIEYRSAQTPRIELGKHLDIKSLENQANSLGPKYLFFSYYREEILSKEKNITEIEADYLKFLQIKKSSSDYHNKEITFPRFTQGELNAIKTIYERHKSADAKTIPYYYIAYLPVPNNNTFEANLKFLYLQYWARKQVNLDLGTAPWESFNEVANTAGFRYILDAPNIDDKQFDILLKDKETGAVIDADSLSSGEKVIFSLILAMYTSSDQHHPDLILFDEPDAYLHPSLSNKMLDVIQNVLVKQYGIKVILTTHSPSTIAIAPEESIYCIDRNKGILEKTSKNNAIQLLTSGISSLSIYYEKVYQVFVEAEIDNNCLSQIYRLACDKGELSSKAHLNFVNLDENKDGGCTNVKGVVNQLKRAGNPSIFGIIDWDRKNNGNERILVLGDGSRYAIDNYMLDPLAVSFLFLIEPNEKNKIGFNEADSIVSVKDKKAEEWQKIINSILSKIQKFLEDPEETSEELVQCCTLGGLIYTLPKWFVYTKGHRFYEAYRAAFPFLKKYGNEKTLYNKIINLCYLNYCDFVPKEIITTLSRIQGET